MDIYQEIKSDHRKMEALLDQLVSAEKADAADRKAVLQQVADELVPHSRAEEAVLYNSMRDVDTDHSVVTHGYKEHMEAESVLRALQVTDAANVAWVDGAKKLRQLLTHHIKEEENEIFTAARAMFTQQEAETMAEVFDKLKPMVKKQSFVGQSLDMMSNLMPSRLRASFAKFANLPVQRAS